MKLHEVKGMLDDEPLLITLIRQRLAKGERVARYYRSGDSVRPMWIMGMVRVPKGAGPGVEASVDWVFRCNKGNNIDYLSYDEEDLDNLELIPGKTRKTWQLRRSRSKVDEGLGSDLVDYMDFAETAYGSNSAIRRRYDKLARELLKRGFSFSRSELSGRDGRFKRHLDGAHHLFVISSPRKVAGRAEPIIPTGVSITIKPQHGSSQILGPFKHANMALNDLTDPGVDLDDVLSGKVF